MNDSEKIDLLINSVMLDRQMLSLIIDWLIVIGSPQRHQLTDGEIEQLRNISNVLKTKWPKGGQQ